MGVNSGICYRCGRERCGCPEPYWGRPSYGGSALAVQTPTRAGLARALACLVALCVGLTPATALAQAPDVPDMATGRVLTLPDGDRGIWWPLPTAQALAEEHLQLRPALALNAAYERKIKLLEERLELTGQSRAKLELQVSTLEEANDNATTREAKLILRSERAEERLARARWIWAMVGAACVVVLLGGTWALVEGL